MGERGSQRDFALRFRMTTSLGRVVSAVFNIVAAGQLLRVRFRMT